MIPHGKHLWQEDDATHGMEGHENLEAAYKRLFGAPFVKTDAAQHEDAGDADIYLMPDGHVVVSSFPGNNAIFKPVSPPDTPEARRDRIALAALSVLNKPHTNFQSRFVAMAAYHRTKFDPGEPLLALEEELGRFESTCQTLRQLAKAAAEAP